MEELCDGFTKTVVGEIAFSHFVHITGLSNSSAHSQTETKLEIGHPGITSEHPVIYALHHRGEPDSLTAASAWKKDRPRLMYHNKNKVRTLTFILTISSKICSWVSILTWATGHDFAYLFLPREEINWTIHSRCCGFNVWFGACIRNCIPLYHLLLQQLRRANVLRVLN